MHSAPNRLLQTQTQPPPPKKKKRKIPTRIISFALIFLMWRQKLLAGAIFVFWEKYLHNHPYMECTISNGSLNPLQLGLPVKYLP